MWSRADTAIRQDEMAASGCVSFRADAAISGTWPNLWPSKLGAYPMCSTECYLTASVAFEALSCVRLPLHWLPLIATHCCGIILFLATWFVNRMTGGSGIKSFSCNLTYAHSDRQTHKHGHTCTCTHAYMHECMHTHTNVKGETLLTRLAKKEI